LPVGEPRTERRLLTMLAGRIPILRTGSERAHDFLGVRALAGPGPVMPTERGTSAACRLRLKVLELALSHSTEMACPCSWHELMMKLHSAAASVPALHDTAGVTACDRATVTGA